MGAFHYPVCFSFSHSLAEIMGGSKIHGHMTVKVYLSRFRGGSAYPLDQLSPLSPTSIEDEAEAGSERERESPLYQNI